MVTTGDLDGDGRPDVAVGAPGFNTPAHLALFLSRPGGLVKTTEVALGDSPYDQYLTGIAVADLNGDFAADVVVQEATNGAVLIFPGDGAGGLGPKQVVYPTFAPEVTHVGGPIHTGNFTARDRTDMVIGGWLFPNESTYCCEVQLSQPAVDKATLWPPNGDMVPVTISYSARSNCSNDASCTVSVSGGDASVIDAHHVLLRAQREGNGSGRTYTLSVSCSDGNGGGATRTATVDVPHDQRAAK
jgi:hypothetical protein